MFVKFVILFGNNYHISKEKYLRLRILGIQLRGVHEYMSGVGQKSNRKKPAAKTYQHQSYLLLYLLQVWWLGYAYEYVYQRRFRLEAAETNASGPGIGANIQHFCGQCLY